MTYNPGFVLGLPDPVPEDGVFLLPLCITVEQFLLIMECVETGGLQLGLGRQGPHKSPFWRAMQFINNPQEAGCGAASDEECTEYRPDSSIVSYFPAPPGQAAAGYTNTVWEVWSPDLSATWLPAWLVNNVAGLQRGDVVTTLENIGQAVKPGSGFPRMDVVVPPGAAVNVQLIEVPQGGNVLIYLDGNVLTSDIVNTSSVSINTVGLDDLLELVIDYEVFRPRGYERKIPDDGQMHTLSLLFVPDLGGDNWLGFGGGVRKIEVCSKGAQAMVYTPKPVWQGTALAFDLNDDGIADTPFVDLVGAAGAAGAAGPAGPQGPAGADGADGVSPPSPQIQVTAVTDPDGKLVEFDMDGDNIYETSFIVLDGADGANAAPTPQVLITPQLGGETTVVQFDMNADGVYEDGFTVFNGSDGPAGPAGPQGPAGPVGPAGECDCEDIPGLISLTDNQKCAVAFYMAEKISGAAKDLAFDVIVNQNSATEGFWALIREKFTQGALFNPTLVILEYLQQEVDNYASVEADLISSAKKLALAELLYCDVNLLSEQNAIAPLANASFYDNPKTAGLVSRTVAAMSSSEWNAAVQFAIEDNSDVDCSSFNCAGDMDVDFSLGQQGWLPSGVGVIFDVNGFRSDRHYAACKYTIPAGRSGSITRVEMFLSEPMSGNLDDGFWRLGSTTYNSGTYTGVNPIVMIPPAPVTFTGGEDIILVTSEFTNGTGPSLIKIVGVSIDYTGDSPL